MSCFDPNITNIVKLNFGIAKSDTYLEVPKGQLRYNFIHHKHFMGHYQTETVYVALVKTYYWPPMRVDIIHFIKHWGPLSTFDNPITNKQSLRNLIVFVHIWFLGYLYRRRLQWYCVDY
jgi:hypothetical protein